MRFVYKFKKPLSRRWFEIRYKRKLDLFEDYSEKYKEIRQTLRPLYAQYVSDISNETWAASLEVSCLLYYLCMRVRPTTILDLGSGFSSYVFRSYAANANNNIKVISVDDDSSWLKKTQEYLATMNVPTDNLISWKDLQTYTGFQADIIFHDLSHTPVRVAALPKLKNYTRANTLVIVDDIHKKRVQNATIELIKNENLQYQDLMDITLDQLQRYQWCLWGFHS